MKNKTLRQVLSFYGTIFIPFLYLINIALAYFYPNTIKLSFVFILIGILMSITGIIIWILSYFYLGKSFGILPQKQKRVTKGLYHYTKHPMYIGIFLTFLGLSLSKLSAFGLIFLFFIITPILIIRAKFEDKKLTD
jgi:protein-S-isoprenylcysteine O-methyltransferase Ste14